MRSLISRARMMLFIIFSLSCSQRAVLAWLSDTQSDDVGDHVTIIHNRFLVRHTHDLDDQQTCFHVLPDNALATVL